jgi:hypothetical protein
MKILLIALLLTSTAFAQENLDNKCVVMKKPVGELIGSTKVVRDNGKTIDFFYITTGSSKLIRIDTDTKSRVKYVVPCPNFIK